MNVSSLVALLLEASSALGLKKGERFQSSRLTSLHVSLCLCHFSFTCFINNSPPHPPGAIPMVWEFYTFHITSS